MNIVGELRYYLGKGYAHLKFSETKDSFSIDTVMVPSSHRGKGIGTFLINQVITLADSMGNPILLSARPIGAFSEEKLKRLVAFYERLGFKVYDTGLTTAYMLRNPSGV